MEMVNVLHSSVCSSAYFSCPLWRLRLILGRILSSVFWLISPARYGGCDLKSAERAHSQADYIETCAVRLNGG